MAKKKDLTRNPPSAIEIGFFVAIIAIIIGLAFPFYWSMTASTRDMYDCVNIQKEIDAAIDVWKLNNSVNDKFEQLDENGEIIYGVDKRGNPVPLTKTPLLTEIEAILGESIPKCPHPAINVREDGTVVIGECILFKDGAKGASCIWHKYNYLWEMTEEDKEEK